MSDWKREVRGRLSGVPLGPDRAEEIAEELGQHLEDRFRELTAAGVGPDAARQVVLHELDGDERLLRELRDVLRDVDPSPVRPTLGDPGPGRSWRNGLGYDVRNGVRALRKSPGLAAVAIGTLALGIGGSVAIFSVVNAVLLRPLPYHEPDRLVAFWGSAPEMGLKVVTYPPALYTYFRARSRVLQPLAAYGQDTVTLSGRGDSERLLRTGVTANFFPTFGTVPALGRGFLAEEEAPRRNQVAVLSHGLWQRRFGGDPGILGQTLTLDGEPTTVVGVMPRAFDFPARTELWVPLPTDASRDCWCFPTLGRLAAGHDPADAAREIARLNDDYWREAEGKPPIDPDSGEAPKSIVIAQPLTQTLVGDVRTALLVLLGAVGMVLLIVCANLANLLLARATARAREVALRCCLGASPWRIVRQLLVESLLLALAGAAVGLLVAEGAVRLVADQVAERLPHVHGIGLDSTVLAFALAVALLTSILFGVAPALRALRTDLQGVLKDGIRSTRGVRGRRLNDAFVVAQFAFSLVLLVGSGLLLRSFRNLLEIDIGFDPDHVFVGRVSLGPEYGREPDRLRRFYDQLAERVRALPGVKTAGLSSIAPFSQGDQGQIFVVKGREPAPGKPNLVARVRLVTPGYFAAVATPLEQGRAFDATDTASAPGVAVVDETLARAFWADGATVGQQLRLGDAKSTNPWLTIVGVAKAVKHGEVTEEANRFVYVPLAQSVTTEMDVVARTATDPAALTAAVRRELSLLDAAVPLYNVHTLRNAVDAFLATRRLTHRLLLGFAAVALLLAAVGLYGVVALGVSQRVGEFGVRLALGATPRSVLRMVLGQGTRLALLGIGLGLAGAFALSRSLSSLLFEVSPFEPWTFAAVAAGLALVGFGACYVPARRATATDPLRALRCD